MHLGISAKKVFGHQCKKGIRVAVHNVFGWQHTMHSGGSVPEETRKGSKKARKGKAICNFRK